MLGPGGGDGLEWSTFVGGHASLKEVFGLLLESCVVGSGSVGGLQRGFKLAC